LDKLELFVLDPELISPEAAKKHQNHLLVVFSYLGFN